jgi:hypothetical protein
MIQRECFLVEARDEATKGRKAASDLLYALQISDGAHFGDHGDFFRVGLDATLKNDEPQEHASRNAEDTLFGVELDVFLLEAFERDAEVVNQIVDLLGFDYYVINVGLDCWPDVCPRKRVACNAGT